MLDAKNDLLVHLKWLRRSVLASGAELILAGDSMEALIRRGQRHLVLQPVFLSFTQEGVRPSVRILEDSNAFAGWLPRRQHPWPAAVDRTEFRRIARSAGLPVPDSDPATFPANRGVLVRPTRGGTGPRFLGPFGSASDHALDQARGEEFEPFIEGHSLLTWCWNGLPVVAEQAALPSVTGDGASTVRELVLGATRPQGIPDEAADRYLASRHQFLSLRGVAPSTVLPNATTLTLDVDNQVPLRPGEVETFDLRAEAKPPWYEVLRVAGEKFAGSIPEPERATTLFIIEAVIDKRGQAWLTSMHANPVVHPLVYPAVMFDMMGPRPVDQATPSGSDAPRA